MATTGNGSATYESGGAGVNFRKRSFHPEINEDPQNISQEAGQHNSIGVSEPKTHQGGNIASISITVGKPELEQMVKQMTFTSSEAQRLIALVQSRTIEEKSQSSLLGVEALTTSASLKKHKHGDESHNFQAAVFSSRVLEEDTGTGHGQTLREDSNKIKSNATQHPTTIQSLPSELLSKIFIRLLAKQLAQMRSVSKSWNALLSHPSFIKSHLHHSIHNNNNIHLQFIDSLFFDDGFGHGPYFTTPSRFLSTQTELTTFFKFPEVTPHTTFRVIGSINGLICSSYCSFICIWNPSISIMLTLPPYSTPSHGDGPISIQFRFGFDPKTDDYKVVKLSGIGQPPRDDVIGFFPLYTTKEWLQVEVYSMRKGSWELTNQTLPSHIRKVIDGDYLCSDGHDGHLHWIGCVGDEKTYSEAILAFDLGSNTFTHEIPLPLSMYGCQKSLRVFGGKLYVMSYEDDVCEVWVMDEYGVVESCLKLHFDCNSTHPCELTSHYGFLIKYAYACFALYDPISYEVKILENYFPHDQEYVVVSKIVEYVDSLVWVTPTK